MNSTLLLLAANLCSIACVVGAILLALHGIGGWGWFLLISVMTSYGIKTGE